MNANLFAFTTDWHVTSNDTEAGITGESYPIEALAVSRHLAGLEPAGAIDLGDCKDHYGTTTGDELDNYVSLVRAEMPWGTVNAGTGITATKPILPGNHDEVNDYPTTGANDFSIWDARMWAAPYHWTCDWAAANVRFIAFHATIIHAPSGNQGFFTVAQSEIDWLTAELAALPAGKKAIVCSHPPLLTTFGNHIRDQPQTDLIALLLANNSKVKGYFFGHRHSAASNVTQDGILHVCGPGMAYYIGTGGGFGSYRLLEYRAATNDIKLHGRWGGGSLYGAVSSAVYTPLTLALT